MTDPTSENAEENATQVATEQPESVPTAEQVAPTVMPTEAKNVKEAAEQRSEDAEYKLNHPNEGHVRGANPNVGGESF